MITSYPAWECRRGGVARAVLPRDTRVLRRTHQEPNMYAIMGITGQIGGIVARSLLADGQRVRAIVRDAGKGRAWVERGCEAAVANIEDAASLGAAFQGASGVFVLVPSNFDPAPGFPEAHAIGVALRDALDA